MKGKLLPPIAVLSLMMALLTAPTASGLTLTITAEEDSAHVVFDVTVSMDVQALYNTMKEYFENLGIPEQYIPTLDDMIARLAEAFDNFKDLWSANEAEFESTIESIVEDKISEHIAGANVENFDMTLSVARVGYVVTVATHVEFDIAGANIFQKKPEERRIDFRWKAFKLEKRGTVAGKTVDSRMLYADMSGFDVPLEQWTKGKENDRIKLSYTLAAHDVKIPGFGASVSIDPTATIYGPPGSADATVSGNVIVMPTVPTAAVPPLEVIIVAALVLVVVLVAVIWRYMSR